jgi:hypothetical protein
MFTVACFNPNYIGEARPRENHVPVVEVSPAPSNVPVLANIGGACTAEELRIEAMDDADDDALTVRFDILRTLGGEPNRRSFLQQSPPLLRTDGSYPISTDNTKLVLSRARLGGVTIEDETQLIELRVSDTGFDADGNGDPIARDGGGVFFMSWIVAIADCPVGG